MPLLRLRPLVFVLSLPLLLYIIFLASNSPTTSFSPLQKLLPAASRTMGEQLDAMGIKSNKKKKVRLLVAGGASELAQAIVPHLLLSKHYSLLLVDNYPSPYPSDYDTSQLRYMQMSQTGTTFAHVFRDAQPAIDGVLHLGSLGPGDATLDASGELDMWCAGHAAACQDFNVNAIQRVVDAITVGADQAEKNSKRPWLILASSTVVLPSPQTPIGETLERTEAALHDAEDVQAVILRLPIVYGGITPWGPISKLMRHALVSLPIQLSPTASQQTLDLIHISDVAAAFDAAIEKLSRPRGSEEPSVSAYNIVSGDGLISQEQLANHVIALTNSQSPVRYLEDIRPDPTFQLDGIPLNPPSELELAWKARLSWDVGVGIAINHLRTLAIDWSRQYLEDSCALANHRFEALGIQPLDPYSHLRLLEADERNQHLDRLDGCTVTLGVENSGFIHHIKCSQQVDGGGPACRADGERVTAMNWNASFFVIHRDQGDDRKPKRKTAWNFFGPEKVVKAIRLRFEDELGAGALGYRPSEVSRNGALRLGLYKPEDRIPGDWQGVFDTYVQSGTSNLRLIIPGTNLQLITQPNATDASTAFFQGSTEDGGDFNLRMTVLCCPREGGWPLLLDDYESSDMRFGSTGVIPFNASKRFHVCDRVEQSAATFREDLTASVQSGIKGRLDRGLDRARHTLNVSASYLPHKWSLEDLPP